MPQKEIVETFLDLDGNECHVMGRDGRYYVRCDDAEVDAGPFASVEQAKASVLEPGAGAGAPVDKDEPDEPEEPEAA
jgi:hypothetical protein